MTRDEYDCIVIGLGGLGSAAAYWFTREGGGRVLGLEQFELGHARGSSEDHSRIIRHSYHTPAYVRLTRDAYATWTLVEEDAREALVLITGGLDFAPQDSATGIEPHRDSMRSAGIEFEYLDAGGIMRRWPQFRLGEDVHGLYQPHGGLVMASKANAAHRRLARAHGAELRENTPVRSIEARDGEVRVRTDTGWLAARFLILAAGPWSNGLLGHLGVNLPLEVTQEQVSYYMTFNAAAFAPGRFPIWIWLDDPCFYGFPVFGDYGLKAAQDAGGRRVTADSRGFEPDRDMERRLSRFLAHCLPGAVGPILQTRTCLYTLPPDRDFIVGAVPGHDNVFMTVGAGHAFKFASWIGRTLAGLAAGRTPGAELAPFAADRSVLHAEDPPRQYRL
jgi:sarcosine oxidase